MDADVVIAGAGLIGLALARELRRRGMRVMVFDAGEACRQASWAGAGMLAARQTSDPRLRPLAIASARLYPSWAAELERETGMQVGYCPSGTLFLASARHPAPEPVPPGWEKLTPARLMEIEPHLVPGGACEIWRIREDHSVDNRALAAALLVSARLRGARVVENAAVSAITTCAAGGMEVVVGGVRYRATIVINAAGAWASQIAAPVPVDVRPRKGQMLRLHARVELRHVIEADGVYMVPRACGRVVLGATVEDVGFAPGLDRQCLESFRRRAMALVPALADAELEETWAGFRPCSSDGLPLLGPTRCRGYWLATGHYRDGILLAPITAKILAAGIANGYLTRALNLDPFLPRRFAVA